MSDYTNIDTWVIKTFRLAQAAAAAGWRTKCRRRWQAGTLSAAESYPTSEVRGSGREEQPHAQGVVAVWAQEGLEEPSHVEGQEGRWEEIPLIQGKEQRLRFAGAAVKTYPTSKVRETQVKW